MVSPDLFLWGANRLQEKGVGTDQEWHGFLQRPLFSTAANETSATLAHISEIFVERHHLVWKVRCIGPVTGFACI